MAKGEGRGWKKYVPGPTTIVKIVIALAVLKLVNRVVLVQMPAKVAQFWPAV